MARHEIVIHENTGALRETAPYVGNYISKEQVAMAEFASAVGAKCGLPPIQVTAIIGGAFEAISDIEREALVRVRTDLGTVCAAIKGSFPTADAAFDASRNKLELVLRLDDSIRLDLADAVPAIMADENLTRLRVHNVMDLVEKRPMNLIHGRHVFRVAGFNMVLTDEGAAAYLEDGRGTTFPLVVDEVVSKQLFKAHTAELLPGGDYKLVVKSRAGDAGGPLQTSFRRVKYLRVVDPEPEPIAETSDGKCRVMSFKDGASDAEFTLGHPWKIGGVGLYGENAPEGEWALSQATAEVDGTTVEFTVTFSGDGAEATFGSHMFDPSAGTYENVALRYPVTRGGETETLTLTIPRLIVE